MNAYEKDDFYLRYAPKKEIKCVLVSPEKYGKLKEENKQLKEALRKCDPHRIEYIADGIECSECGGLEHEYICNFCENEQMEGHLDNCEYVQLTKESEDK